jgi:UDP-N-acetylglucosamine 2-epimerase (non-hydrolysing)
MLIAGARPNFMKIAPICQALKQNMGIDYNIVHTGQHYDENMSKIFFDQLDIPRPDINLNVGSDSHALQTANIMIGFEKVLNNYNPDLVIVVGDVNSTLACSLVASKLNVPVAHVEAGLRSFNWKMPEEINRVLTDRLSLFLFTTCEDANQNLIKEGIEKDRIFFVGNVMIDTLLKSKRISDNNNILQRLNLESKKYGVLTLHRPSNVDSIENLLSIFDAIYEIQKQIKVIYPVHPRTKKKIVDFGLEKKLDEMNNFEMIDPLGYLDFLQLMDNAQLMLTDSGGIQEETTVLGVPCITLREETERPITITEGTNVVVGRDKEKIIIEASKIINGEGKIGKIPLKWDGNAARRIVDILIQKKDLFT